ncbi:dihydrodipicolinate synthase family protein [Halotalea alkalilenta]|uniref:Dihydrodipicolinate synthase family protein n=1 Tax=Halotalea alkalilenta TaxID=376489 RepID=A0A172YI08_9GAMM|nr:dihydrodipicolinate synthase family protein [Halotalea alkalilenta]ANF58861.1 dihydrodipicolinate synthase family protein [Halotalea alkalilenta]
MTSNHPLAPRIEGLFNICVTPFDDRGELDRAALELNLERAIGHGYDGILIGGTYGEFAAQTTEERAELFTAAMAIVDGRLPVLLCAASGDAREACELTELAGRLGGLPMLTPPYACEITFEHTEAYFAELAARSATGVMIYNAPGVGATLSPAEIERLAAIDGVVALKQGELSPTSIDRLLHRLQPRLKIIAASDLSMVSTLSAGVDGLSSTNSCALPELIKAIFDATRAGRLDQARALHRAWFPLRELCRRFGQPQTTKAMMRLRGWRAGGVRAPLRDLDASQLAELSAVFADFRRQPLIESLLVD